MRFLSKLLYGAGYVCASGCCLIGYIWCLYILSGVLHIWGTILAVLFIPATISLTPWYEGFHNGNWLLLAMVYGGLIVGLILTALSGMIAGDA